MIRPGPASETAKPCGMARGMNTSEPGPACHAVVPAEAVELAVQDEQRFVGLVVEVGRRGEAGRYPVIEDAQLAVAVAAADLGDGQGVEEPERLPLVGRDDESAGAGVVCWFHCLSPGVLGRTVVRWFPGLRLAPWSTWIRRSEGGHGGCRAGRSLVRGVAIILTARLPEANAGVGIMSLPRWVDVSFPPGCGGKPARERGRIADLIQLVHQPVARRSSRHRRHRHRPAGTGGTATKSAGHTALLARPTRAHRRFWRVSLGWPPGGRVLAQRPWGRS